MNFNFKIIIIHETSDLKKDRKHKIIWKFYLEPLLEIIFDDNSQSRYFF